MRRFALRIVLSTGSNHVALPTKPYAYSSIFRNVFGHIHYASVRGGSDGRLESSGWCRQHPGCRMQRRHVGRGGMGEDTRRPRHAQSRCLKTEQADLGNADPDRHEEEDRRRSMGRPSLQRQGRTVLQFDDQAGRCRPDGDSRLRAGLSQIDMKKKTGVDQWEGQVYNAKDGQFYSSTIKPVGVDQMEIQGCVLGFLCGGETWPRVAGPIPSSPANGMAKGTPKPPAAPKTTGSVSPAAKTSS